MSVDVIYIDDTQSNSNTHITQATAESLIASEISGAQLSQSYTLDFEDSDLTAGKITFTHNLNQKYVVLTIYDDSDNEIIPDESTAKTTNTIEVNLASYGTISGTWNVIIGTGGGGSNTDSDAVHKTVAGEFTGLTEKATPVNADLVLIEDSADSGNKKKVQVGNLPGGGGGSSPLTTKGDVYGYDTADARLPVGTNGQAIIADSSEALGIKWGDVADSSPLTTKGDLYTYDSDNQRLAVGSNDEVLISDSAEATGLKWGAVVDATAIHTDGSAEITGITEKTIPVSDDVMVIEDSASSNVKKKVKMSSLWAVQPSPGTGFATIDYTDFTDNEAVAFSLPSKSVVTDVHVEITDEFDTGYTGQCGYDSNKEAFISAFVADVLGLKNEPYNAENEMLSTSTTTDIKIYMASPSGTWTADASMSGARKFQSGCGSYNDGLQVGGNDGATDISTTEEFNGTSFSAGGALPANRGQGNCFGVADDAVYNGGGVGLSTVYTYNGTAWSTSSATLNTARRLHGGSGSSLNAIIGGGFVGGANATCELWNGTTFTTTANSLNTGRYYLAMNGDGDSAISMGGNTGSLSSVCEKWNGTTWIGTGSLNSARASQMTLGGVDDAKYIAGTSDLDTTTEDYNGSTWSSGQSLSVKRNTGGAFGTSGLGLVVGGTSTASPTTTSEKWASATITMGEMKVYYSLTDYGA